MPRVDVVFFRDTGDKVPGFEFLSDCNKMDGRVTDKFTAKLEQLAEMGWDLRRPDADILRDGVYELRVRFGGVHYRLLYGFHQANSPTVIIVHGCTKKDAVSPKDIDIARKRLDRFIANPAEHTHEYMTDGERANEKTPVPKET